MALRAAIGVLAIGVAAPGAAQAATWAVADGGDSWCLVEHHSGDVQIWFGSLGDGTPVLTVDVRGNTTATEIRVDEVSFSVSNNERSDTTEFRELSIEEDQQGFLDAAAVGMVLRAGTRAAWLDGLGAILAGDELGACLENIGWTARDAGSEATEEVGTGRILEGVIFVSGQIDARFADELEAALDRAGQEPVVVLGNSPGGRVVEAERAARALRSAGASVFVEGECASACVSVMAGGVVRSLGATGRLGLHRASFEDGGTGERGQEAVAEAADFFREMGVSVEVAIIEASVPSNEMRWLTAEEARDLLLLTD